MSKRKQNRRKKKFARFIENLKVKAMRLDWVAKSSQMSDNQVADMLDAAHWSFTRSPEWRALRLEAIKRYGTRCAKCGKDWKPINIDHIKPRRFYPHLALDINNLQPLCGPCNKEKGNGPPVDYRSNLTKETT